MMCKDGITRNKKHDKDAKTKYGHPYLQPGFQIEWNYENQSKTFRISKDFTGWLR